MALHDGAMRSAIKHIQHTLATLSTDRRPFNDAPLPVIYSLPVNKCSGLPHPTSAFHLRMT